MGSSLRDGLRELAAGVRVRRALIAGAAATIAMTIVFLGLQVQTRARLGLFEAIARFVGVPDSIAIGFIVFAFFGVVGWPLLFAAVEPHAPTGDDRVISGMLFGGVLWLGFLALGTTEIPPFVLPFYAAITLIPHLVYGFTLGFLYGLGTVTADGTDAPDGPGPANDDPGSSAETAEDVVNANVDGPPRNES